MSQTYTQCPKCKHPFPQPLPASASCPACGIYLFKWGTSTPRTQHIEISEPEEGFSLTQPMENMDDIVFYGRCAAWLGLLIWSYFLFAYDYREGEIGGSFMHNILLPIHEAGHVLFRPFGEFMTILGGSLFQLLFPFAIGVAFIIKNRDNFGASVGLWWASVSLVDLSPYIYDALQPQLILLGGSTGEDGPHDWIFLLNTIGQLSHAQRWGMIAHTLGGICMLAALVWGAWVLWRQREYKTSN